MTNWQWVKAILWGAAVAFFGVCMIMGSCTVHDYMYLSHGYEKQSILGQSLPHWQKVQSIEDKE